MDEATAPVLNDAEIAKRTILLAELKAVLAEAGVSCKIAGRQRLVPRYSQPAPHAPSGQTDVEMYVLSPPPNVITTDGASYRLRDGREFPVSDRISVAAG